MSSFGLGSMVFSSRTFAPESKRAARSGGQSLSCGPNLSLKSDPACIAFRPLSTSRYLGFVRRLGAGGAA
jgi:hypothetical protein